MWLTSNSTDIEGSIRNGLPWVADVQDNSTSILLLPVLDYTQLKNCLKIVGSNRSSALGQTSGI